MDTPATPTIVDRISLGQVETEYLKLAERTGGLVRQQADQLRAEAQAADRATSRVRALADRLELVDAEAHAAVEESYSRAARHADVLWSSVDQVERSADLLPREAMHFVALEHGRVLRDDCRIWYEAGLAVIGWPEQQQEDG